MKFRQFLECIKAKKVSKNQEIKYFKKSKLAKNKLAKF